MMRVFPRGTRLGAYALAAALLAGCAGNDTVPDEIAEAELYQQAMTAMEAQNYTNAVSRLEALDARYPFGEHAEQAQLELIYAYYQAENYESARAAASRFIRLQPDHPQVDYAYYLRGLAAYQAGRFSLEGLKLIDISKRDLGATRESYSDFRDLIERYPDSEYAPDAEQRLVYLRNVLARHELQVADFYLRKGAYLAAVKRGRWVISHYPEAPSNADALAVMVEGYLGLGMTDRAREVLTSLIENAPNHERLDGRTFRGEHVKETLRMGS